MSKPHIRSISLDNFGFVGMKTVAEYKRLDELCHLNMGQSPDSNSYNDNGEGLPFYQGNADFGVIHPEVRVWCNAPTKIVDEGSLLISVRAPIGALNIANERCCIGRGLAGITSKDGVNQKYIYYCLKGKNRELNAKGTGSTFKAIAKNALGEVLVKVVSEEEQEKIVFSLDKITTIIESRKQQLQELDNLVKARFVEVFGDLNLNPKGYDVKKLSEIAEYWNGLTYRPEDIAADGTVVLRSSNIQNSQLDFADVVRVNCAITDRKYVKSNDILMCSRNGSARLVGKVALIKGLSEPMSFGAFMMIIRSKYYSYLMTLFQLPFFREQIATSATTTINQITVKMLDDIKVPVPDINTLNKFTIFVEEIDKSKVIGLKRVS